MNVRVFTAEDYDALSLLASAGPARGPITAAQLHQADERRASHLKFGGFLAEIHTRPVGFVWYTQYADYYHPNKVVLRGYVLPDFRQQGIGKALLNALVTHLVSLGISTMQTEINQKDSDAHVFLLRRGFKEVWRRTDYSLAVEQARTEELLPLSRQLEAQGITIVTYPQLSADPERDEKLRALNWELEQEVPYGEAPVELTLHIFIQERLAPEHVLKNAFFVAIQGNTYIGMSSLWHNGKALDTEFTGVLRAYRGQSVARLMKLHGINYAKEHGYREIHTTNDENNYAMRAVNARLGFEQTRTVLRLERTQKVSSGKGSWAGR